MVKFGQSLDRKMGKILTKRRDDKGAPGKCIGSYKGLEIKKKKSNVFGEY